MLRHAARARSEALGGNAIGERLVRPLEVIDFAPGIEGALRIG